MFWSSALECYNTVFCQFNDIFTDSTLYEESCENRRFQFQKNHFSENRAALRDVAASFHMQLILAHILIGTFPVIVVRRVVIKVTAPYLYVSVT